MRLLNILIFFLVCHQAAIGQKSNVTIYLQTDSVVAADKQWVYVWYQIDNDTFLQDSTYVSPERKDVVLHAYVQEETEIQLTFAQKGPNHLFLTVSPNDTVHVDVGEKDGGGMVWKKITGSPATNEKAETSAITKKIRLKLLDLENALFSIANDSVELQRMNDSINALYESIKNLHLNTIRNSVHPRNVWSALIAIQYTVKPRLEADSLAILLKEASMRFPDYAPLQDLYEPRTNIPPATEASQKNIQRVQQLIREKFIRIREEQQEAKKHPPMVKEHEKNNLLPELEGKYALYRFALKSYQGDTVSLAQLCNKNKYVLIDFWASWCIPCMKGMGLLKRIREQYKDKISICLISLDVKEEYWMNAIKRHQLEEFTNLLATEDGKLNKEIERLKIKTIPHNYLLSPKGEIIAIDLFGAELAEKIKGLLK